ncbi:SunT ABC-type bacteriocin/lantibiotic exporters, contain an N-terminal double-glycine peptidase domain [Burkholderiaceae bacterium]
MSTLPPTLHVCLMRIAQLQMQPLDRNALQEAVESASQLHTEPRPLLKQLAHRMHLPQPKWVRQPDPSAMPLLAHHAQMGWLVLRGLNAQQAWVVEVLNPDKGGFEEKALHDLQGLTMAKLSLAVPFESSNSPVYQLVKRELLSHKRVLAEAALAGLVLNLITLAVSFYSMQVYDRVVPTGASQTLMVLTLGVLVAAVFELTIKHLRSHLYAHLIDNVDQRLSRAVYLRFLSLRLDQLPRSVGTLASQLRGHESVRGFLTTITSQLMIDAPFAILFLLLLGIIGTPFLALIPLGFLVVSVSVGLFYRKRVEELTRKSVASANLKTGLLVETVEGAETIKSGQGGWRMLSRWMHTNDDARSQELQMRDITERNQHLTAFFQQVAYVLLVASGALMISRGELSVGALIACSILSGRVLQPVAMIPAQLVQWASVKASLQALDRIWQLEDDHHGVEHPLTPETIQGGYKLEKISVSYGGPVKALVIPQLQIQAGEKVGILGPIGAGKTTLLRLLSGMYKPQEGRVLLDQLDLAHISKPVLAEHVGFLQQEGRLFAGSLRDNLILGLLDPGDDAILAAAEKTGLQRTVINDHPKGLMQEITEGGQGLSAGQRQLVNLTRLYLREPTVWLLDEPTASMDRQTEGVVLQSLRQSLQPQHTLVVVTHKPELLVLVNRLIVVAQHQVVLDGPRDEVLARLNNPTPTNPGAKA